MESIQDNGDSYKLRENDPEFLVHSTNLTAWKSIQKDYFLKSSSQLDKENIDYISIGFQELKEPEEYKDFIMFGGFGYFPEFIVLSQQKGRIVTDKDCTYEPGVRIYLDCHKMIKDKFSNEELERSSRQITLSPLSNSLSHRCDPMKPTPPETRIVLIIIK